MQLYLINWSFENSEDQLFATNEFCNYLREGKLNNLPEGIELKFIAHTPQNGSGIIICIANNAKIVFNLLNMWRKNYSIAFNIQPAMTNEELIELNSSKEYWSKE
tara:strand:+ start:121 stop:435 length:315 start_codon:yes stop_codon:yes gene_type:complete